MVSASAIMRTSDACTGLRHGGHTKSRHAMKAQAGRPPLLLVPRTGLGRVLPDAGGSP